MDIAHGQVMAVGRNVQDVFHKGKFSLKDSISHEDELLHHCSFFTYREYINQWNTSNCELKDFYEILSLWRESS